ncbi:MAG: hypothetical protein LBC67_00585 [Spirochaetales bacterium]|jgi:hypothetical protein|nr:hypothetical protein [Spirochaetales bacterium]
MRQLRVYIENSVIGGYFDTVFEEAAQKLFEKFRKGEYHAIISTHTYGELNNGAPENVKSNLETISYEKFDITEEMTHLTQKYMDEKIVNEQYRSDALHIAIATVLNVDVLVSWNFKHIVNLNKIKLFNSVNLKEGYNLLEIRTPGEVI